LQANTIQFEHNGTARTLSPGGHFAAPKPQGFRDTATGELRAIVAEIEAGRPWSEAVTERYAQSNPWLHAIVTSDRRQLHLDKLVPPGDGWALDIGAGWGQASRPLAKTRPVVALEPVSERLAFIRASARQEGADTRLAYVEADYLEVNFTTRFQVITAIGVLEWVGAFQDKTDPRERQRVFLAKTRRELAPGGCLIVGIENRLGLKYLLGCSDDHLGVPHIACLPADRAGIRWREHANQKLATFTYSRVEMEELLRVAGFTQVEFFAAFPDYKVPQLIVPLDRGPGSGLPAAGGQPAPAEHNGYNGTPLPESDQQRLRALYGRLAQEGVLPHFVPSFFIRAS
jgi:ubiquinone/menaquinone biosynthesis C-methylase UbiE